MKEQLIRFITHWEGCSLTQYYDVGHRLTVGVGHLIRPTDNLPETITQEQADDLLWGDLQSAIKSVRAQVKVPLNTNRFISLVDYTFNLGGHTLQRSTLRSKLNRQDYQGAAGEF